MLLKPIVSDAASEILRDSGIVRPSNHRSSDPEKNRLRDILDNNGLSLEETIRELSLLATGSQDETIKLRSIDTALKLHGAMKDEEVNKIPAITINIVPLNGNKTHIENVPAILIPREVNTNG